MGGLGERSPSIDTSFQISDGTGPLKSHFNIRDLLFELLIWIKV